ncbi:MAG: peptidoglycan-binding protein [bacterium]|nr:peptidoglycan-binding protein [bacterium]
MKSNRPSIRFLAVILVFLFAVIGHNAFADSTAPPLGNKGVKAAVEELFADAPQMIQVAQCESRFQQYTTKGTTFTGSGGRYVGVFQIAKSHVPTAKKLGFNIYTLEGNLGFAKHLYEQQGVRPWRGCVKAAPVAAEKSTSTATVAKVATPAAVAKTNQLKLTKKLGIGAKDPEVKILQKILNASGFFVARSGPGSSGQETTIFNSKTRDALKRFQCIKNIACRGTENSTGYGYVGPSTRSALLTVAMKQGL